MKRLKRQIRQKKHKKNIWYIIILGLLLMVWLGLNTGEQQLLETWVAMLHKNPGQERIVQPEAEVPPDSSSWEPPPELTVHFIDVGQGDATLLESDGFFMLIDAGENEQADKVVTYLHEQGVDRLEYVIGTHPHSDHIGAMDDVLINFPVGRAIFPPVSHDTRAFENLETALEEGNVLVDNAVPGTQYMLGSAAFTILAPIRDYEDNLNNWSVAVRVDYGETSFLFTGDAEQEAEMDLCASGFKLKADVLKLGHHGSSTSTTAEFLEAVAPDAVVISCGTDNSYGSPSKKTMKKVEELEVYRTDEQGDIVASSDGKIINWSVSPGSKSWGTGFENNENWRNKETEEKE